MKKLLLAIILLISACQHNPDYVDPKEQKTKYHYGKTCLDGVYYWSGNSNLITVAFNKDSTVQTCIDN